MTWQTSIVIPAFNRERFIGAAIESCLAQTFPAAEIIVVDDGSTDRTAEIAARYPPPVRLIRIDNNGSGPSRPRNVGIAAANSEYITLLDSDDLLAPTMLASHRNVFAARPDVGIVCSNWLRARRVNGVLEEEQANEATVVRSLAKEEIGSRTYLIRSCVAHRAYCRGNFLRTATGATLPKAVCEHVGGFDESLRTSNDYDFFIRVLAKNSLIYIDAPLFTVVHHEDNISAANLVRGFRAEHALNHLRVLRREYECANSTETRDALRGSIQDWLLGLAYGYRTAGSYSASIATYLKYLAWGGNPWIGLKNMAKVPACCLLSLFGQQRGKRNTA